MDEGELGRKRPCSIQRNFCLGKTALLKELISLVAEVLCFSAPRAGVIHSAANHAAWMRPCHRIFSSLGETGRRHCLSHPNISFGLTTTSLVLQTISPCCPRRQSGPKYGRRPAPAPASVTAL